MSKVKSTKFRFIAFLLCALLVISGFVPVMGGLRAKADGTITIYFDTGKCPDSNTYGFYKSMENLWYHVSNHIETDQNGNEEISSWTAMTKTSIPSKYDPTNGKVFKAVLNSSYAGYYISFTGYGNQGQKAMYRTARKPGVTLYDGIRIYDDYPSEWGKYRSTWFNSADDVTTEDMSNKSYAIANMTGSKVTFTLRYSDGTHTYDVSEEVDPRDINHNVIIPNPQSGHDYYTGVQIYQGSSLLKEYDFNDPQKKIPGDTPGNTFVYGITTYETVDTNVYDEGDKLNVCFYEKGRYSLPNVSSKYLYFSGDNFPKSGTPPTVTINGTSVEIEPVTKISNASFKTKNPVNLIGTDSQKIIEVVYGGATYRMLWRDTSSDLIITSGNTKRIKGKYTVQTVDQTGKETGDDGQEHNYTYRTAQADFYDYQYDHNSETDPNFVYSLRNDDYLIFTDSQDKEVSYAYFFGDSYKNGPDFPGVQMTYLGREGSNHRQYAIKIPAGAEKVIFARYDQTVQTEDITIGSARGFYMKSTHSGKKYEYGEWDPMDGKGSLRGAAKRPYLAINEALSASSYSAKASNYPMYLGQFWLPFKDDNHNESSEIYNDNTKVQRAAQNGDDDKNLRNSSSDSYSENFGIGNELRNFNWSANLAFRSADQEPGYYKPYDAVVQGLVNSKLDESGKLMAPDGTNTIPYFDTSWWTKEGRDSFTDSQGNSNLDMSDYIKSYEGYDFPFFKVGADDIHFKNVEHNGNLISETSKQYKGDYYVFDSGKNVVRFEQESGETVLKKYYDKPSQLVMDNYGSEGTTNDPGFFPFNTTSDSATKTNKGENLHYGFGVKFSIDFYLPENGTVDGEADGTPVTFTFQGDDDVWVFLDGKLILDMGGAHKNSVGEINFADKKVYVGAAADVGTSVVVGSTNPAARTKDIVGTGEGKLGFNASDLKIGKHTITMFYLERGMLNSNLYVMFNLPTNISYWEVQEDTDFNGINTGLQTATKMVADKDVFNYQVWNKGTDTTASDMDSHFRYPTYVKQTRSNDEANNQKTELSRNGSLPTISTTTKAVNLPTNRIYLDPGNDWGSNHPYGAWVWNSSDDTVKGMFVPAYKEMSTNRLFIEIDRSRYDRLKWIKMNDSKYIAYRTFYYPPPNVFISSGGETGDLTIPSSSNIYYKQSGSWGSVATTRNETVQNYAQYYNTYNFKPSGKKAVYDPVVDENGHGVTYNLTDKFADSQVVYNTRSVDSGYSNVISLQYSEMGTLRKQFTLGSMMKVTQLDELSKPATGNRDENGYASSSRLVSDYYDTYLESVDDTDVPRAKYAGMYDVDSFTQAVSFGHVESMYANPKITPNYSVDEVLNFQVTGTTAEYNFQDPSDATNTCLHLRQVYVNAVKTANLMVVKSVNTSETNNDTFTFTIQFNNVFGGTEGDNNIDYSTIYYKKNGGTATPLTTGAGITGGRFEMKVNDYVTIEGIPVGTHYTITESTLSGYVISNSTGNIANNEELTSDTTIPVMNVRALGKMRVQKLCYDSNTGVIMTGVTNKFPIIVTLTNSTYDLTNYSYTAVKEGNALLGDDFDVQFSNDKHTATITLMVTPNDSADFGSAVELSGIPLGSTYSVAEGATLPMGYSQATIKPSGSAFANSTFNHNTSATYSNVFYDKSTHTIAEGVVDIVTVENEYTPIIMPTTGVSGIIFIFPLGILAITLSGAAFVIYNRRMNSGKKAPKGRYVRK